MSTPNLTGFKTQAYAGGDGNWKPVGLHVFCVAVDIESCRDLLAHEVLADLKTDEPVLFITRPHQLTNN